MLLNSYSSMIVKSQGSIAVFDPVKLDLEHCGLKEQRIDAVVITHEHIDHYDEKLILELQKQNNASVITTRFIAGKLMGMLGNRVKGLAVGESEKINGMEFHAEYCEHVANESLSFIVKTGSGTIYHPDDSKPFPGMKDLGDKYKPDVMVYLSRSARELTQIAEMVRPRIVIYHLEQLDLGNTKIPGIATRGLRQLEIFAYP